MYLIQGTVKIVMMCIQHVYNYHTADLNVTFVSNYFNQLSSFTIFSRSPSARGKRDLPRIGDFARELRGRLFDDDDNEQEGDDDDNNDDDDEEDSQDRTPGGGFDERGFLDRVIRDSVQNAVDLFQDQGNCVRDVVEVSI